MERRFCVKTTKNIIKILNFGSAGPDAWSMLPLMGCIPDVRGCRKGPSFWPGQRWEGCLAAFVLGTVLGMVISWSTKQDRVYSGISQNVFIVEGNVAWIT